jgi:hypothetical protein
MATRGKKEFKLLQLECGGLPDLRTWRIWRAAITAEHQAEWRRGRLAGELVPWLKLYRTELGLPELPDSTAWPYARADGLEPPDRANASMPVTVAGHRGRQPRRQP